MQGFDLLLQSRLMFLRVALLFLLSAFIAVDPVLGVSFETLGRFSLNVRVIEGPDGVLYGLNNVSPLTIARVNRDGTDYRVLSNELPGVTAFAFGKDGMIYGSTLDSYFRVTTRGHVEILGATHPSCRPGEMILAPDGNVYGITFSLQGGGHFLVRMGTDGSVTDLTPVPSGIYYQGPWSLVVGHDGALWGTFDSKLFRVQLDGTLSRPDPNNLITSQILVHPDGNYYGFGYGHAGWGSWGFYRMTAPGEITFLADSRYSSLTVGSDGYFYGINGLRNGIARVSTNGEEETIVAATDLCGNFCLAHDGALYGTRNASHLGELFRLSIADDAPNNLPPIAVSDVGVLPRIGSWVRIPVLENDTDADGDELVITDISAPLHGSAYVDETGHAIVYSGRNADRVDADEFNYTIVDDKGATAIGRVVIRPNVAGRFVTLLPSADPTQDGYLRLDLAGSGAFTGRLWLGGLSWPLSGILENQYRATLSSQAGSTPEVRFHLLSDRGEVRLEAEIVCNGETHVAEVGLVSRKASFEAGRYTWMLPPDSQWVNQPTHILTPENVEPRVAVANPLALVAGHGCGVMQVASNGNARVTGRLPDGVPFSVGSSLAAPGRLPLFAPVYRPPSAMAEKRRSGWVRGSMVFRDMPNRSDADGSFKWAIPFRNPAHQGRLLATANLTFLASRYTPAENLNHALKADAIEAQLQGGGLPSLRRGILASNGGKLNSDASLGLTGTFWRGSGVIFGKIRPFGWRIDTRFLGVVFQKQKRCVGLIDGFGSNPGTGSIRVGPPAAKSND